MPPFVITLVTYTVAQGTALAITSGSPINNLDPLFSNLSQYYIGEVPVPALFFVGAAVIAWFVLERICDKIRRSRIRAIAHMRSRPAGGGAEMRQRYVQHRCALRQECQAAWM